MIIVNLDIMMARRKISLGELAEKVDITPANFIYFENGKRQKLSVSLHWRLFAKCWTVSREIFWNFRKEKNREMMGW